MKHVGMLLVLLSLLLGLTVLPASAQDGVAVADLTALAQYFPEEAPLFVSFRTDDAFLTSLDTLLNQLAAQVPGAEPVDLFGSLDEGLQETFGADASFDATIRSWLGDTGAFGILSFDESFAANMDAAPGEEEQPPFVIAVEISDRAAAEALWAEAFALNAEAGYEQLTQNDYTVFASLNPNAEGALAIGDDVLLVAANADDLPLTAPAAPLSASATFNDTLALLPESAYNATLYMNLGDTMRTAMANAPAEDMAAIAQLGPLFQNFPAQAIGAVILDGRSLVLDVAQPMVDLAALEAAGFPVMELPAPVDLAFAQNIPSGTPLVLHASNLAGSYNNLIATLRSMAEMPGSDDMSTEEIDEGLQQLTFAVRALTGLDFEEDVIGWMTGDYALYLRVAPSVANATSMMSLFTSLPVDFAFVAEATDPDKARAVVEGLQMAVEQTEPEGVAVGNETIGGTNTLVLTITTEDMPFPIELLAAANDAVFAFGSRPAVTQALTQDGSLANDASFAEAGSYLLPNPTGIAFLGNLDNFTPLLTLISEEGEEADVAQLQAVLGLISSATISTSMSDDGSVVLSRAVLTLSE